MISLKFKSILKDNAAFDVHRISKNPLLPDYEENSSNNHLFKVHVASSVVAALLPHPNPTPRNRRFILEIERTGWNDLIPSNLKVSVPRLQR
jgi:hypothetical protein